MVEAAADPGMPTAGSVLNPAPPWFGRTLAAAVLLLETWGWLLLAGFVLVSLLWPSAKRAMQRVDARINAQTNRRREAELDREREQVRKRQAEAYEMRVREVEEQRPNANDEDEARARRLRAVEERAARLGFQTGGRRTGGGSGRGGGSGYSPLMGGGGFANYRSSRPRRPRGGGG